LLRLLLLPTWHYFLWNLVSQSPGVHDQGEGSASPSPLSLVAAALPIRARPARWLPSASESTYGL
ncbi:hypothetical protein ACIBJF_45720, partial [Streptomyces sp. NPDC050743]|uniref:hypothetical protein n=1 Tax=Streptomyces sp. NPDC050743 TaxID=3365634 RepID=UPI00378CD9B1